MGCIRKETCDFCDARCPNYMMDKRQEYVDIKPNEIYIDAVCQTTPLRQRALWGLSLKLVYLRMKQKFYEEVDVLIEFSRLFHMTDEEYNLEVSGNIRK